MILRRENHAFTTGLAFSKVVKFLTFVFWPFITAFFVLFPISLTPHLLLTVIGGCLTA